MIWFFKSLIVFIFQFNISSAVADGGVSNNNIQDIYLRLPELLNETTMICPEKIWPKYNWSSMSVLLVEKGLQTTVWKASDNSVNYVEEKDTPAIAYQGLYKFLQWNGNIGLSINPAGNPSFLDTEALFGLIIHEGFHRIGQENWQKSEGPRGTIIPYDPYPRIYRQMLFKNMKSYFLDPSNNPAALNKAAYWYKLWATTFPDEEKSSADGYEGTAKYVEEISKIYADKKCTANTNEVFQKLSNLVSSDMYTYKKPTFRLDAEGYAFGSLAGFILSYKENNSSWFSEMSLGKTPIDILLDNRTPTFEPADTNLEKNYVDEAKIANDQVDQMLGPSLQDFTNKSFVRIVLTGSFASYSPKGFFLPKQLPDVSAVPLAVELNINTSYSIITIKKDTVLFSLENPCDKTKFTALVPEKDFIIQNGSVLLQSNGLNGKLRGSLVTDKNGYSWFCGVP